MNTASAFHSDVSATHKCPRCEFRLSSKMLARHLLEHSTRIGTNRHGKYQCAWPRCGKLIYGHNNNLVEHYYTHTDARPFGCADCGLLSNSKSSILRHVKRWHPERYEQIKAKEIPAWISRPDAERLQAERGDYEFPSFAEDAVHLHGLEGFATPPGTVMRDLLQLSPAPGMVSQGHEVDIAHHGYYGVPSSTEAPIDPSLDLFLPDPYAPGASPFTLGWHDPATSGTLFSPHGPRIDHGTTAGNDLGRFTTVNSDVTGPRSHAYHVGSQTADALAGSGDAWRSGAPSPAADGPSTSSSSQPQVLPSLTGSFNWTPLAGGMYRAGWDDSSYQNSN